MISLLQESVGLNERVTSSLLTETHTSTTLLLWKQQIMVDSTHTWTHPLTIRLHDSFLNVTNTHDIVEITSSNNLQKIIITVSDLINAPL